ncbi:hypothetical protein [Mangrovimonas futianensis]|uniref:hypothetical protein n=1 Tax=Mangrovimonas futianensis TaxID=2895523 RepID=UPI001E617170|nr:hypothetical protein [Mangrovimonas futianensis]MCF1422838.1 hypothetical protein [Mangrovimonas futianensis]
MTEIIYKFKDPQSKEPYKNDPTRRHKFQNHMRKLSKLPTIISNKAMSIKKENDHLVLSFFIFF